jgi:hypothetical protein
MKVQCVREGSKKETIYWGNVRKLWGRLCKKKNRREWECLSSLGKAKEVSIEGKHNKCQKSNTKKISSYMSFGVYDKAFSVFKKIRLVIHQRKVGFALWPMLREFWALILTRLCHFLYKDNMKKRLMNNWCWS